MEVIWHQYVSCYLVFLLRADVRLRGIFFANIHVRYFVKINSLSKQHFMRYTENAFNIKKYGPAYRRSEERRVGKECRL